MTDLSPRERCMCDDAKWSMVRTDRSKVFGCLRVCWWLCVGWEECPTSARVKSRYWIDKSSTTLGQSEHREANQQRGTTWGRRNDQRETRDAIARRWRKRLKIATVPFVRWREAAASLNWVLSWLGVELMTMMIALLAARWWSCNIYWLMSHECIKMCVGWSSSSSCGKKTSYVDVWFRQVKCFRSWPSASGGTGKSNWVQQILSPAQVVILLSIEFPFILVNTISWS